MATPSSRSAGTLVTNALVIHRTAQAYVRAAAEAMGTATVRRDRQKMDRHQCRGRRVWDCAIQRRTYGRTGEPSGSSCCVI